VSGDDSAGTARPVEPGGAWVLTSPLLARAGFAHGFFTRRGGVSRGPFESLNFARGTGDTAEAVEENLRRAAAFLGIEAHRVYFLSQTHGVEAHELDGSEPREEVLRRVGDITLSRRPGVGCGVRSADCATVLLADVGSGAVAAVHSGWRGTVQNVVRAAIEKLGADPQDLLAAVGPHIEPCCFEVGDDVATELAEASRAGRDVVLEGRGERPHVDLRAILRAQLGAAGLAGDAIDDVRGCTVCDGERFFSYRRDGKIGGRLLSCIAPRSD
jgi:YfiH family protein